MTMQPIPISAAREIAKRYGYDQVVIVARKTGPHGNEHVTSYGRNAEHCHVAARIAAIFKERMGWTGKDYRERDTREPYTRTDAGTGRVKPLTDEDWPNN